MIDRLTAEWNRNAVGGETAAQSNAARPFSIRLTHAERVRLEAEAGSKPLGQHIRARLFGAADTPRRAQRAVLPDQQALARVLAALGRSDLMRSLQSLSHAARAGALDVPPETQAALDAACQDVRAMRGDLMRALGYSAGPDR